MTRDKWNGAQIIKRLRQQAHENLLRATIIVQRAARRNVRTGGPSGLHRRTGQLENSIIYEIEQIVGRVGSNLRYARIHELGGTTRPHVIRPRRVAALRFFIGADVVFARSVRHPGSHIPPRPYLRPALDQNLARIRRELCRPLPGG